MSDIKNKIKQQTDYDIRNYIRWKFESIAPTPFPRVERDVEKEDSESGAVGFIRKGFGVVKEFFGVAKRVLTVTEKNEKEKIRTDFEDVSFIKINKIGSDGKFVDVKLIDADTIQKRSDPTKWNVLVLYTGSGEDSQAVGIMVRSDTDGSVRISEDNLGGES